MQRKSLIIQFTIHELDDCIKAVTNQYVDLTVYAETHLELMQAIPAAVQTALQHKYPPKTELEVKESATPNTYIADFLNNQPQSSLRNLA